MKLVTLIFLFAISKWSYAQIFHLNDTLYVFTSNGINLRDSPGKEGKITKKLKIGEKLIVTGLEDVFDEIDKREGRWLHVKLNKTEGYIFSGFCSKHIPPSPPLDSFELQNHFIDWLSSTTKNDTLIHEGQRTIKGYDGDGKDWASINWELYSSGTYILGHIGYEWSDYSIESMDIYPNDLMNYFDFIKQFRKKSEYEGPISYEYSKQDHPFTFKIINFFDARVIITGNTIKIFVHEFDL